MTLNKPFELLKNFFFNKKNIIIIYMLLAVVMALLKYFGSTINNYLIFKNVYFHFINANNLYTDYPTLYFDTNHYGPFFSVVIAPFAILPDWLGCSLWNLCNVSLLLLAIFKLPLSENKQKIVALLCLNEVITALASYQFNVAITGFLLLTFILLEAQNLFLASVTITIGILTKLYGIIGFVFFFFIKQKVTFILVFISVFVLLLLFPAPLSSLSFLWQSYQDWFHSLVYKANYNITSDMADISLFGLIRSWFGVEINVLYGCIIGIVVLGIALLRQKQHQYLSFRLLILCNTLLCIVLFNTNVESPTFVIAFFGIAIWYVISPKTPYLHFLLIFALLLTSLSATDLFPKFIRLNYVKPLKLKVLPCIFIWIDISYKLLCHQFSTYQNDSKQFTSQPVPES